MGDKHKTLLCPYCGKIFDSSKECAKHIVQEKRNQKRNKKQAEAESSMTDRTAFLEIARIALRRFPVNIGAELDLSEKEIKRLLTILENELDHSSND